jgi:iron complex outermembrane receptor protein
MYFSHCLADENIGFSEQDYFEDIAANTTATRLPQSPEQSPVSITIIDRKMIEASSAIEIVDLLRLVPGMRVAHANSNLFSVAYHGYASAHPNRMEVLIDGRSVITPLFSLVDWNNLGLTINDIERIEVVRGPNSPAYGAYAVRGTINIITRKPFQVEGQTIVLTAGSIGTRNGEYRYASVKDNYEQSVNLIYRQDDGFNDVDDYKRIKALTYRNIYAPDNSQAFDLQLGLSGGPKGGWGVPGNIETPVRTNDTRTHYESLRWTRNLGYHRQQIWSVSNNFISWDDKYIIDLSTFSMPGKTSTYSLYSGNATRTELEFQQSNSGSDTVRFAWGGSVKMDRLQNTIILNRPDYVSVASQRAFVNVENQLGSSTILNAGVMAENNGLVGLYLSPRLALNHAFTPMHTARVSATQSRRTPSLYEYYNDNIARLDSDGSVIDIRYKSDPDLQEETLTAYELGYIGHYLGNRLDVDAKLYYERFEDLIRNVNDSVTYPDLLGNDTFIWMNTGYTINKGYEIQLKFTGDDGWSVDAQYAYARHSGKLTNKFTSSGYEFYSEEKLNRLTPRHSYSLLLNKQLQDQWQASAGYYFTSTMEWLGGGNLDDMERLDVKLSRNIVINSTSTKVSLVVQNVLNDYFEYENYLTLEHIPNVFETRGYLQLELNY